MKQYSVTQLSTIRGRWQAWYDRPSQVHLEFKKSTVIIWLLVLFIVLSHVHYSHTVIKDAPLKNAKLSSQKSLPELTLGPLGTLAAYVLPPPPKPVTGCGNDPYMAFIYQHESGCNTGSINSIGCAGLGQSCPASKMPCSLSDWACQNNFFTAYADSRYGSPHQAMVAWQSQGWW